MKKFVFLILFILSRLSAIELQESYSLSARDIKLLINNLEGKEFLILDVRTQEEYNSAHLTGAILIPVQELEHRFQEILSFKNKPVIVYCRSGSRSLLAIKILKKHGFSIIYNMKKGINEWIKKGYKIFSVKGTIHR